MSKPRYGVWSNITYTLKNIWRIDSVLLLSMLALVFTMVVQPLIGIYMPKFIIQYSEEGRSVRELLLLIAIFGIVSLLVGQIRSFADGYFPRRKSHFRSMNLGSEMCMASLNVHYKYLSSEQGQLEMRKARHAMSRPSTGVEDMVTRIVECSANLLGALVYIIILSWLNPLIILLLILCGIFSFLAGNSVNKFRIRNKDAINKIRKKQSYVIDASKDVKYAKDVRMYGMFQWLVSLGQKYINEEMDWEKKISLRVFISAAVDGLIAFLRDGFAYIYLILLVLQGSLSASEFVLYIGSITGFSMWVSNFVNNAIILSSDSLEVSDYRVFLDQVEENANLKLPDRKIETPISIELRDICFSYGDKVIFDHLNLKIEEGKKIALVGINGAGKSTLIKLILNLLKPDSGEILINGIDSRDIDISSYFDQFSVAFQDALVLAYGIDVNISMKSREETDQKKVDEVIELSGLSEKVRTLPKGKYTSAEKYLDREGTELSGGERQKLILARALYKDAPVLILDEPSSALDPIAEAELYEKYHDMTRNKTSIYISHRLSSTKFCDEVLLLDQGQIVERGTHEELMKEGKQYAHMFQVQSQYYNEETEVAS
ncbi:ABC transporter ATP-binding protein [Proteiniclasticum sp. SCR006]|uniref:ABC transporter ATP-binding protein n=1 Tax=Proteiniclasticum aestuarii TaxID=2817862 RepID=A0A939HCM7_9CLOT|nr:ABC transporter ATP-binding protein [Proteiniclasticum aestuarii]MBO1264848.1 ABC transporter ATP-binding protein [Proteiniclasticum aestuarii]